MPPRGPGPQLKLYQRDFWKDRSPESTRCSECGRPLQEVGEFDVHHRDGLDADDPGNLEGLCVRCHLGDKHGRDVDQEGRRVRDPFSPPKPAVTGPPEPRNLSPR